LGQPNFAGEGAQTVTTWMTNARYRVAPLVMLYGRVSTGSQPNALTAPGGSNALSTRGETDINYEVGVKSEFLERRVLIDLTLYRLNRSGMVTGKLESGYFNYTPNGGTATAKGMELTSSYSPFGGLTLGYNAVYTQSAYTGVNAADKFQLTGYQLRNVPKWNVSITAAYDWALTPSWHAHAGGDLRSVGEEWDFYVQRRSLGGTPVAALPSYTVLNFNAAIAKGPLSVKFFARNLADKRADLNSDVIVNDYKEPVGVEHYILQPRTVGIGFDRTF
jgi:outer membrane receptor for ferric coprogen and ferric-rhodotorulic acid